MHWTFYGASWLLAFLLELILVIAIIRRCLQKEYPLFFSYLVLELIRTVMLAGIGRHHPPYFYAYWISECVVSIFGFFVVREIFRNAFERRLGLHKLGAALFRYSLLGLLITAVLVAAFARGSEADRMIAAILVLKSAESFMRMGLIASLFIFVFLLGLPWSAYVIGIAVGFAVYGSIELAVMLGRSYYGSVANGTLIWSIMIAGISQRLVWVTYFTHRQPQQSSITEDQKKYSSSLVAVEVRKMNEAVASLLRR